MDMLGLLLLFNAGLIAALHIGFRALLRHAVDLREHHPERYSGTWRALGDLAPSAKIESLRATILATLAAVAVVAVLALTDAIDAIPRSPTGLLVALVGLALVSVGGMAVALLVARRRNPPSMGG